MEIERVRAYTRKAHTPTAAAAPAGPNLTRRFVLIPSISAWPVKRGLAADPCCETAGAPAGPCGVLRALFVPASDARGDLRDALRCGCGHHPGVVSDRRDHCRMIGLVRAGDGERSRAASAHPVGRGS